MHETNLLLFWLLVILQAGILYFVVLLADNLMQKGLGRGRKLWKQRYDDDR